MTGTVGSENIVDLYATGEQSIIYWTALSEGRLVLPRCFACETTFFFPRRWCPSCWSDDVRFVESLGSGTIYAVSELHTAFQGVTKEQLPVAVVIVELDEGIRIPGRLAKTSMPGAIGDRVVLRFAADPATELPCFVAASSDSQGEHHD